MKLTITCLPVHVVFISQHGLLTHIPLQHGFKNRGSKCRDKVQLFHRTHIKSDDQRDQAFYLWSEITKLGVGLSNQFAVSILSQRRTMVEYTFFNVFHRIQVHKNSIHSE